MTDPFLPLNEMENRPDQSFKCGPFALAGVRKALGVANALAPEILEIKSPYRGFSLTEVAELATKLGMPNTMAKWSDGAEIPVPSVVNWKLGHYAAVICKEGESYRVKDLTFGFDNLVSAEAVRAEASEYFLLPVAKLPQGFEMVVDSWRSLSGGRMVFDATICCPEIKHKYQNQGAIGSNRPRDLPGRLRTTSRPMRWPDRSIVLLGSRATFDTVGVTGSNPVSRTILKKPKLLWKWLK